MVVELLLRLERLGAHRVRARERPLRGVRLRMAREQRTVDKGLAATLDLADPGLVAGVDAVVPVEAPLRGEALAAVRPRARVGLLARLRRGVHALHGCGSGHVTCRG